MTADKKWCIGCKRDRPLTDFYRDQADRPYGPCKECRRARQRPRNQALRAELAELRALVAALTAQQKDPAGARNTSRAQVPEGTLR